MPYFLYDCLISNMYANMDYFTSYFPLDSSITNIPVPSRLLYKVAGYITDT
jgi:hypothetical protein